MIGLKLENGDNHKMVGKKLRNGRMFGRKLSNYGNNQAHHNINNDEKVSRSDLERTSHTQYAPKEGQNLLNHGVLDRLQYQRKKNH